MIATALQSTTSATLRNLRQFFETEMSGLCRWDHVKIVRAGPTKSDDDEIVKVSFAIGEDRYTITVTAADTKPPLGLIKLTGVEQEIEGPIDSVTWSRVAEAIKTQPASQVKSVQWE